MRAPARCSAAMGTNFHYTVAVYRFAAALARCGHGSVCSLSARTPGTRRERRVRVLCNRHSVLFHRDSPMRSRTRKSNPLTCFARSALLVAAFGYAGASRAQEPAPLEEPAPLRFRIVIDAPKTYHKMLE